MKGIIYLQAILLVLIGTAFAAPPSNEDVLRRTQAPGDAAIHTLALTSIEVERRHIYRFHHIAETLVKLGEEQSEAAKIEGVPKWAFYGKMQVAEKVDLPLQHLEIIEKKWKLGDELYFYEWNVKERTGGGFETGYLHCRDGSIINGYSLSPGEENPIR